MKNKPTQSEPPGSGTPGIPGNRNGNGHSRTGIASTVSRTNFSSPDDRPALITGGAGFIGTNVADRLLREGHRVIIYDNLSRDGVEHNARWLQRRHGSMVQIIEADVRDMECLSAAVRQASRIFHFAAQVAVTTSLDDPIADFEVNARGTLNLLEAIRATVTPPPLLFTSTNKVYGALPHVQLRRGDNRYEPADTITRRHGVNESQLDFHSPYGCSKGAADQYVIDYARTFGLPAVVFRMSCIYGPHQFGTEDQGWVAHFLIRAMAGQPITIYGDGMQVRDILFADDLVDAMLLAHADIRRLSGQAFNIGGGPSNTISLLELLEQIEHLQGRRPKVLFEDWRPGDQHYYVSDVRRFGEATGWQPKVNVEEGLKRLHAWLVENRKSAAMAGEVVTPSKLAAGVQPTL